MQTFSPTEENYIKAIYHLSIGKETVATNAIAEAMDTTAASVTDMLRKLNDKQIIDYTKYKGVSLTRNGEVIATQLVRKHRLWEVFLKEKLGFAWDKVHDIAEQLEHIRSEELIERLDVFLGNPKFDPHGDPIPDAKGRIHTHNYKLLSEIKEGDNVVVVGVKDSSAKFLNYLDSQKIALGSKVRMEQKIDFDNSVKVQIGDAHTMISDMAASLILVM
jgi:DtxR family Mn-dependent transcriptional regulator